MSDLQRSFARAQLSKLPPEPIPIFDEREEDEEASELPSPSKYDSSSSASSTSSTGTIVPSPSKNLFSRPHPNAKANKNTPLPWQDFFGQELSFENPDTGYRHHAYLTPPSSNGPLIVTHHGAGSSALSFAAFTKEITSAIPNAGVLSSDARGHGQTVPLSHPDPNHEDPNTIDLSLPTLASDLAYIVRATQTKVNWPSSPPIVLLGHSLGGAVIVELATTQLLGADVLAYGVLDVVEGSAMDALSSMESYLSTRPTSFASLTSGIEWHLRSRTIRDNTSARVSVPAILTETSSAPPGYIFRTPLAPTKPFWPTWFTSLSSKFLAVPNTGKLLILAGTDRLDKPLMIGQMQGKYQLSVFPEAGHFVHEDCPAKTAAVVAEFWRRNDRQMLVLPPKVGDLIKRGEMRDNNAGGSRV